MSAYLTRLLDIRIGGHDFQVRALKDLQQFSDPDGAADQAGISSALWPLFGQAWPAGRILANEMSHYDVAGKRVLEIGCGLALSSLVLQQRGADITASDHHPLAGPFLAGNAELNGLAQIPYCDLHWERPDGVLGLFDLIIGDWDRHEDQWRWAEQEDGKDEIYEPIARDRDQTFFDLGTRTAKRGDVHRVDAVDGVTDEGAFTPTDHLLARTHRTRQVGNGVIVIDKRIEKLRP